MSEPSSPAKTAWSECYAIGHLQCDRDHQRLLELTSELVALTASRPLSRDQAEPTLAALSGLMRQHFKTEEGVMVALGFPALSHHRQTHQVLIRELEELAAAIAAGRRHFDQPAAETVQQSVEQHILTEDLRLGRYLDQVRYGGQ